MQGRFCRGLCWKAGKPYVIASCSARPWQSFLIAEGVVGLSLLGLPDVATAAAATGWAVLVMLMLFGRGWAR